MTPRARSLSGPLHAIANQDQWSSRIDHTWSPRDFIYGSFIISNDTHVPSLRCERATTCPASAMSNQPIEVPRISTLGYTRILLPNPD